MAIGVRTLEEAGVASGKTVRVLLLHDADGKVLVLLPWSGLLNLNNVWKDSGRKLQPVRGEDARRFFGQEALGQEDGLRKLLSLPLLLDQSLQTEAELELYEPHSARTFRVPSSWLEQGGIAVHRLGLTRDDIDAGQPDGDDRTLIYRAVEKFTALRIRQRLEDTLGLPSLSPTTQKIIMMRCDPEAGVDGLVPVVRVDPSLSAQVMSWAASSYYAVPGKVHSLEDAIIRVLGFDLVINLALGVAMGKTLELPKDTPRDGTDYWQQAVYCATLAERLCAQMPRLERERPRPGLAYLAGLLHNFGYLVLAHLFPPHFSLLSRYLEANPHIPQEYVEKQVLNVTREQVGSWLMESWSLPAEVCVAVRRQNECDYQDEHWQYAALVCLSSRLLRQRGLSDGPIEALPQTLLDALGLDAETVSEVVEQLMGEREALDELTRLFEIARRS
ncbi:aminoacyl-tRNA deacylase and HDOD domain-containing protein [Marinobacterium aestuariivivens]|uniref:Aminoacyl-tRNA deacylase and HDOD domain-containing protein n=1 Tax=Marinobacterium aestuariivivens TaxID=1698799 RepID=A0ABW2A091_9GAMM